MAEFETEEQELEALKKWLKENGPSLVIGLVVGVGGLFGWRAYLDYKTGHAAEASDRYQSVLQQVSAGRVDEFTAVQADLLRKDYADTPYAVLASLAQAKHAHVSGNNDEALAHLDWVMKNAATPELGHVARLRMARLLIADERYDEAGSILDKDYPEGFAATYEELRGDLHVARGDLTRARIAYDKALRASTTASRWLQLKRQDLGESETGGLEQPAPAGLEPPA